MTDEASGLSCRPLTASLHDPFCVGEFAGVLYRLENFMGRGDKRSRKGKIFKGSYGNSRLQKVKKAVAVVAAPAAKVAKKA